MIFGASSGKPSAIDLDELRTHGSLTVTRPTLREFVATTDELRRRATEVYHLVRRGQLRVHIGGIYPLAEAAAAHADLVSRRTVGKVLLAP